VRIEDVGDTDCLIDEQTHKFRFLEENELVVQALSDRPFCMYVRLQAGTRKLGRCGVPLASHDSHLRSVCRPLSFFLCNDPLGAATTKRARASSPTRTSF
jgi:hypothetical protein